MNIKDFLGLDMPLGKVTRLVKDFISRFIHGGSFKSRLHEEAAANVTKREQTQMLKWDMLSCERTFPWDADADGGFGQCSTKIGSASSTDVARPLAAFLKRKLKPTVGSDAHRP
jgi:hypothetical protein